MEKRLDAAALEALIVEICAPWVQELDIKVLELGDNGAQFVMPATEKILRHRGPNGGLVSGQALMAGSDTVSFFGLELSKWPVPQLRHCRYGHQLYAAFARRQCDFRRKSAVERQAHGHHTHRYSRRKQRKDCHHVDRCFCLY